VVIETARLCLRPYEVADAGALFGLWTDPIVRRYLFDDELVTREWVLEELERNARCFAENGFGQYAILLGEDLIGFCGFRHFGDDCQLLFGLDPRYHGRGLAAEAARAMIRHGFDVFGFDRITAAADAPNEASIRVMRRVGMRLDKRVVRDGVETFYFSLEADS